MQVKSRYGLPVSAFSLAFLQIPFFVRSLAVNDNRNRQVDEMFNSCVIIGKAMDRPEFLDDQVRSNRKYATMKLECDAAFQNPDGSLDTEIYDVLLWRGIAEECVAAVHKGTTVAIRGHLSSVPVTSGSKTNYLAMIVAEKVVLDHSAAKAKALAK